MVDGTCWCSAQLTRCSAKQMHTLGSNRGIMVVLRRELQVMCIRPCLQQCTQPAAHACHPSHGGTLRATLLSNIHSAAQQLQRMPQVA